MVGSENRRSESEDEKVPVLFKKNSQIWLYNEIEKIFLANEAVSDEILLKTCTVII